MAKAKSGAVVIQSFQGRLRLVWSYQGKRYFLTLGLIDNTINKLLAQQTASNIEIDMVLGKFDESLDKYRNTAIKAVVDTLTVTELVERFWKVKQKSVSAKTYNGYKSTLKYLALFFKDVPVSTITVDKSEDFLNWFTKQGLSFPTVKSYLIRIRAIWNWAIEQNLLTKNPWINLVTKVRLPSRPLPRPFTRDEMNAIIEGFKKHKHYSHYADYVLFLFGTGVRTGEAIGLRWGDLSTDCTSVLISEQLTRGERKPTKTNRERTFLLPNSVTQMLLKRRPESYSANDLVFTAPQGGALDDHNFQRRAWTSVINQLGIPYRKPYTTRSTAISLALESGMSPVTVAAIMGHDVSTLFSHYAGSVVTNPQLPDL